MKEPAAESVLPGNAGETGTLLKQMAEVVEEQQDLRVRYGRLEEQNATLAALYVACQSLHHSLKRSEVLLSVREIVANLIGCEEYALFMSAPDGLLRLVDSLGLDPVKHDCSGSVMNHITNVLQTGEPFWAEDHGLTGEIGMPAELTACIPLRRDGAVTGVLALFRLLPQKFELHEMDRDLLRLLEVQLALALYCAELHEKQSVSNEVGYEL